MYIKVTFKAQAFFADAQQSKSWYLLTQGECREQDQTGVVSAFDLPGQNASTAACTWSCFPLAGHWSWGLSAKTLLPLLETSGLPHSQCWGLRGVGWFAAHIVFKVQILGCAICNEAIPATAILGPDGRVSWWTVGHLGWRWLKKWELSGNVLLYQIRKMLHKVKGHPEESRGSGQLPCKEW